MAETQENQELEDIQPEEADEVDEVDDVLEEIGDTLAFLRDNSDDLNLYMAFKAYHDDRDYEDAIEKFQSAIEYEKEHGEPLEAGADGEERPNEALVKSFYWMAESHLKIQQPDKATEIFETVASDFGNHYLGQAAQRRADKLKTNQ